MLSHTAYIPYLNVSSFLPALSPAHSGKYNSCRFHCSVEVTVLSTNKQHSLPVSRHRPRFQAHHKQVALVAQPDVEKFCAPLALSCRPIPDSVLRAQELASLPRTPVTPVLVVVVLRFPADPPPKYSLTWPHSQQVTHTFHCACDPGPFLDHPLQSTGHVRGSKSTAVEVVISGPFIIFVLHNHIINKKKIFFRRCK